MSFYSAAQFYRPGKPVPLTAADLADFIEKLASTPLGTSDPQLSSVQINWGKRIDKRIDPWEIETISWRTRIKIVLMKLGVRPLYAYVTNMRIGDADIDFDDIPMADVVHALRVHGSRRVSAASIMGALPEDMSKQLGVPASDENPDGFDPFEWGFTFGPAVIADLWDQEAPTLVGWMRWDLGGNGHFHPLTFTQWHAERYENPLLKSITDLCRETWPCDGSPLSRSLIKKRERLEDGWPYPTADRPLDWCWGPHSG